MAGISPVKTGPGFHVGMRKESCDNQELTITLIQCIAGSDRQLYHDIFRSCYEAGPIQG